MQLLYIIHRCIRNTNNTHTYITDSSTKHLKWKMHTVPLYRIEDRTAATVTLKAAGFPSIKPLNKVRFDLEEEDKGAHSLPLSVYTGYLHGMHVGVSFLIYSPWL